MDSDKKNASLNMDSARDTVEARVVSAATASASEGKPVARLRKTARRSKMSYRSTLLGLNGLFIGQMAGLDELMNILPQAILQLKQAFASRKQAETALPRNASPAAVQKEGKDPGTGTPGHKSVTGGKQEKQPEPEKAKTAGDGQEEEKQGGKSIAPQKKPAGDASGGDGLTTGTTHSVPRSHIEKGDDAATRTGSGSVSPFSTMAEDVSTPELIQSDIRPYFPSLDDIVSPILLFPERGRLPHLLAPDAPPPAEPKVPTPVVSITGTALLDEASPAADWGNGRPLGTTSLVVLTCTDGVLKEVRLTLALEGIFSGWRTLGGDGIFLFTAGGRIVGRTKDGKTVLSIEMSNGGRLTVSLFEPLKHGPKGSGTDTFLTLGKDILSIKVTAIDSKGGLHKSDFDGSGLIRIKDDSPHGDLPLVPGTDGGSRVLIAGGAPDGFVYKLDTEGALLVYQLQGGIEVLVRKIALVDGRPVETDLAPVNFDPGASNKDISLTISYRVTDGDGDTMIGSFVSKLSNTFPPRADSGVEIAEDSALPFTSLLFDTDNGRNHAEWVLPQDRQDLTFRISGDTLSILQMQDGALVSVYRLTIRPDGTVSVQKDNPLRHAEGDGENRLTLDLAFRVIDSDGDAVTSYLTFAIRDSLPVIAVSPVTAGSNQFSEEVAGRTETVATFEAPDGIRGVTWSTQHQLGPDFRYQTSGNDLLVQQKQNGDWVTVMTFRYDIATGRISVTENRPLLHASGSDSQDIAVGFTVIDRDGDSTESRVTVKVTDTAPTVTVNDAASAGNQFSDAGLGVEKAVASFAAVDGVERVEWSTQHQLGPDFRYQTSGNDLLVQQKQNGDWVTVMTFRYDIATGRISATENRPLLHASGSDSQDIAVGFTVIDRDGDRTESRVTVKVTDTAPTVTVNDAASAGNQFSDAGLGVEKAVASFAAVDGVERVEWSTQHQLGPDFRYQTSGNDLLVQQKQNGDWVTVMTFRYDIATGRISVPENRPLLHASGSDSQDIAVGFTVIDRDGDSTESRVTVKVTDTAPTVTVNDAASAGNQFSDASLGVERAVASFAAVDGVERVEWSTQHQLDPDFRYQTSGNDLLVQQKQNGDWVTVMTFRYDIATGKISATENRPLLHASGSDSQDIVVGFTVTDRDGDSTESRVTVKVTDTAPSVTVNDAASAGNQFSDASLGVEKAVASFAAVDGVERVEWSTQHQLGPDFRYQTNGNDLLVQQKQSGDWVTVMTFRYDIATGKISATENRPLLHASGSDSQDIAVGFTVIDRDGDSTESRVTVKVTDTAPSVTVNDATTDEDAPGTSAEVARFSAVDGLDSIEWSVDGAPAGDFQYVRDGATLLIQQKQNGIWVTVLTFRHDMATGSITATEGQPLLHRPGSDSQQFTVSFTVFDKDGDGTTRSVNVSVHDTGPQVRIGTGSFDDGSPGTTKTVATFGATDGVDSVTWSTDHALGTGFRYETSGNDLLVKQNQNGSWVTVMTFRYDIATGEIKATQNAPLLHPAGSDHQNISVGFSVTDRDGDTETRTVTVDIGDSRPEVTTVDNVTFNDLAGSETHLVGSVTARDGMQGISWATDNAPQGFRYSTDAANNLIVEQEQGQGRWVKVMTFTYDSSTGGIAATENNPVLYGLNSTSLDLSVTYTASDRDGDRVASTVNVTISATNAPSPITTQQNVAFADDATGGSARELASISPLIDIRNFTWKTSDPTAGFRYEVDANDSTKLYVLQEQGDGNWVRVMTFTYDAAADKVLGQQDAPIRHAADSETQNIAVCFTLTDANGANLSKALTVHVTDTGPNSTIDTGNLSFSENAPDTARVVATFDALEGVSALLWSTTGAPSGFRYVAGDGNQLKVQQLQAGAWVTVMTFDYDLARREITAMANNPILHADGGGTNAQSFSVTYTVRDADGDNLQKVLNVTVEDTVPVVTGNSVTVSESATDPALLGSFSALDGFGSFSWGTPVLPSGFAASRSGESLVISQMQNNASVTVMVLTYDAVTGKVLASLRNPILHGNSDPSFTFSFTVTDRDGDAVTQTVSMTVTDTVPVFVASPSLTFVEMPGDQTGTLGTLAMTDGVGSFTWTTSGAPNNTFTYASIGTTLEVRQTQNNVSVLVMELRYDPATGRITATEKAPILHPSGTNALTFNFAFRGTDKDGDAISQSLSVTVTDTGPQADITNSVRDEGATGQPFVVAQLRATDGLGTFSWETNAITGFTVVNSGNTLTIRQSQSGSLVDIIVYVYDPATGQISATVKNPVRNGPTGDLHSFNVTFRIADKDLDWISRTITTQLMDTTPVITVQDVSFTEQVAAQTKIAGTVTAVDGMQEFIWTVPGAQPAGFQYQLDATNGAILYVRQMQGSTWVTVLTLTYNAATREVRVTENAPFQHDAGSDSTELTVRFTASDKDGDGVQGSFKVTVNDTAPVISLLDKTITEPTAQTERIGTISAVDGIAAFAWSLDGAPSNQFTYERDANNANILCVKQLQNGSWVTVLKLTYNTATREILADEVRAILNDRGDAEQAFDVRFTVRDNDGDESTGTVRIKVTDSVPVVTLQTTTLAEAGNNRTDTVARLSAADGISGFEWADQPSSGGFSYERQGNVLTIRQDQGGTPVTVMVLTYDSATGRITAMQKNPLLHALNTNPQPFEVRFTVTDNDGDAVMQTLRISVTDTAPVTVPVLNVTCLETETGQKTIGTFSALDGVAGVTLAGSGNIGAPNCRFVTKNDGTLDLVQVQGGRDVVVMTFSYDLNGSIFASQRAALLHASNTTAQDVSIRFTVTDRDGSQTGQTVTVKINDTLPTTAATGGTFLETALNRSVDVATFSAADGVTGVSWQGLGAKGTNYQHIQIGNDLAIQYRASATAAWSTVFLISFDLASGKITARQVAPVTHAAGSDSQNFDFTFRVTDGDGDTFDQVVRLVAQDSAPVSSVLDTTLVETAVSQTLDLQQISAPDGIGRFLWSTRSADANFSYAVSLDGLTLTVKQGTVTVLTFSYDNATGEISVVKNQPINHTALGPNANITLNYTATDRDGDALNGTLNFSLRDNAPSNITMSILDEELRDGKTYTGTWGADAGSDALTKVDVTFGGVMRTLDLTRSTNSITITVNGVTLTMKADRTYIITSDITRDTRLDLTLKVCDSDGSFLTKTWQPTIFFVNKAPSMEPDPVILGNRNDYVVTIDDIGFADADGNSLKWLTVTETIDGGSLRLNGRDLSTGDRITLDDIRTGKLVFRPPADSTLGSNFVVTLTATDDGGTLKGGKDTTDDFDLVFTIPASTQTVGTNLADNKNLGGFQRQLQCRRRQRHGCRRRW
ncbi:DUF5801 repeats-in-toxin domain-containing protein [Gellertiella hungarica]|uniref:DUF5801 domain-containing protein n=1 Tax=Gellertiella hungarica TaxID=1572859 RepID=A0A7W6J442_9HYPH|nr:hypothetical protein [Gellertiella hungarica]MBB4064454.1 hypothetical protein [Gellertiella hungarica]